jgi:hypothetical protein
MIDRPFHLSASILIAGAFLMSACGGPEGPGIQYSPGERTQQALELTSPVEQPALPAQENLSAAQLTAQAAGFGTPASGQPASSEPDFLVRASPEQQVELGPHETVASSDGHAELLLPPGALPSGVKLQDVKLTPIDTTAAGFQIGGKNADLAYTLEPQGTVLNQPAWLRVTINGPVHGTLPAVLSESAASPGLPRVRYTFDFGNGDSFSVAAEVPEFGNYQIWESLTPRGASAAGPVPIWEAQLSNPGPQTVGVPFTVTAGLNSGPGPGPGFSDVKIVGYWGASWRLSAPGYNPLSPPASRQLPPEAKSASQPFICQAPGPAWVQYEVFYSYSIDIRNSVWGGTDTMNFENRFWADTGGFQCAASSASSNTTNPDLSVAASELSGVYRMTIVSTFDPSGDAPYIGLPSGFNTNVRIGSITVTGSPPWVNVTGVLNPDGSFKATGSGTVAGYHNVKVEFDGTITAKDGLVGDYLIGGGGGQPTKPSITYHLQGQRVQAPAVSTASTGMQAFLAQLTSALRTNDAAFLFGHLHPAAITMYGAQTCQTHFQQRSPDPTYNIEVISMSGPASWVYAPPGQPQVTVADVYTVNAKVTQQGQTTTADLHIGQVGGQLYWFSACQ